MLAFFNRNASRLFIIWFVLPLFFLFFASTIFGQPPIIPELLEEDIREEIAPDTTLVEPGKKVETIVKQEFVPDPSKSWKYSAILPGLGQAYNRSYWKIPIIYAGLGTVVYVYNFNNKQFHKWRNAYIGKIDQSIPDEFPEASEHALKNLMDTYRRYREYTILAGIAVYVFNILEAYVHAHLLNFDVSEDLSLRVEPGFIPAQNLGGFARNTLSLKLTLNF
jgi:hypothetical protein